MRKDKTCVEVITRFSIYRTLDVTTKFPQSLVTYLNRGPTVYNCSCKKVSTSQNCFSYHVVFLDVSAHGNVQLVGNCSCAVRIVTSGTCIVDCQCVRLQKKMVRSIYFRPKTLYV